MATITVNIDDQSAEKTVKAFLDKLGLDYFVDQKSSSSNWWENQTLINELEKRSEDLKSGIDKGSSFADIKNELINK
ncbi:hypothetical protein [Pedobacter cryotolerans]|uniref:Uncharacterized protein n=1 Tax=Pedobacter cryotolerans TaxID=2571270 RepID=A0A4V5NX15_9SPHI|nr:hypothetical protein [Pedobacter cryotolerans]TKB97350.1 hypothetical protein FA045_16490 [Pedobacter cryotolerans]